MLAERRQLSKRDPSQRVSVAADIVITSPAHHSTTEGAHGSGSYHGTTAAHRTVSELSRLGSGNGRGSVGTSGHARANSDPNLAIVACPSDFNSRRSSLTVNKDEYTLGQSSEFLTVFWDIREPVSASDWIGLYKAGETSPFNYLEYKTQGENRSHVGKISWHISCDLPFTEDVTEVCFKYYGGSTGVLRTTSPTFKILRGPTNPQNSNANGQATSRNSDFTNSPAECIVFRISRLHAFGLKKGIFFNPDPYIKMTICPGTGDDHQVVNLLPHHSQEARTPVADNTINPNWNGQFTFVAYANDLFELDVKDKFSKSRPIINRFLGRLSLPLRILLDRTTSRTPAEFNFVLVSKHPSDHVTGQIAFTLVIEKRPGEPWPSCLPASTNNSELGDGHSCPGTPELSRSSSVRISKHSNGNVVNGAESLVSLMTNNNNNNNNNNDVILRHRQLQQSDFEPALRPKLSDRTNHSTWHGRTASRAKAECRNMATAMDNPKSMATSMYDDQSPPPLLPRLAPKSKRPLSAYHRPLHRTNALQYDGASTSGCSDHRPQCLLPEDSFNFKIVDTDDLDDNANINSAPNLAPLATPEQDAMILLPVTSLLENVSIIESSHLGIVGGNGGCDGSSIKISNKASTCEPEAHIQEPIESHNQLSLGLPMIDSELVSSVSRDDDNEHMTSVCSDSSTDDVTTTDAADQRSESGDYHSATSDSSCPSPVDTSSGLPQCPPTPTHHARAANGTFSSTSVTTSVAAAAAGPSDAMPALPPPLPARHLQHRPITRLPSIPERTVKFQSVELSPGEEPLPTYWEARIDSHGRIFYIDHLNRTTTWQRPSASQLRGGPNNEQQRLQLDRRYQSIRRTISSRPSQQPEMNEPPPTPPFPVPQQPLTSSRNSLGGAIERHQADFLREVLLRAPAVRFVTRPDFLSILHTNGEAFALYNRNSSLKHMIIKIRRDAHTFERYQHNRDLVTMLNKFADPEVDLPRGWETKYDRTGKQFFIDHTSKSTTFIDPRLPYDIPYVTALNRQMSFGARRRSRSAGEEEVRPPDHGRGPIPPPRPTMHSGNTSATVAHVVPHVPTAYSDKVVAFLRQSNIVDILRERHPAVGSNLILKDKINCIRVEGLLALNRLSDDIDLIILLSLFEQEIMSYVPAQYCHRSPRDSPQQSPQSSPALIRANARAPAPYKRDFEAKLRNFYRKLESKGYGQGPGKLKINIRRDHLLEDAFNKIMMASKKDLQKSKLYVTFAGEEGLDYGGPSREFFFLLSRELFNPYYGLFEYSANDTYTVQVSPMSAFVDNLHEWFRFSGRVLGLALVHQYLLDAFFTRPFYKALLRILCSLSDLESLDAEFHQSLLWIKDNDVTDILDLYFSVNEEVFGQIVERELRPGGKSLLVTEKNKKEYIEKVVKWRLERGVAEQTESLVKGFYEVVDPRLVSVFDARELELVIAGIAEVDINDWRKNTEYRSGYHDNHPVIHWFWLAIEKIDNERRLRLLQFVTGSSSIPYEGFGSLRGSNGPRKFCIEKWGKPSSLPRAHTCFNRIDLPPYPSFELLYEKLLLAVEETSTFGIE